ncbi:MAG: ATP-binding protein, partial [Planctomycetota bacterium]
PSVSLVRPLLQCHRAEVVSYLADLGQQSREDPSNADLHFRRNCIRRELLPLLRTRINRDVDGAVLRLSQQAAEVDAYFESQADALLTKQQTVTRVRQGFQLAVEPLPEPTLLVREALRLAWRRSQLPEGQMDRGWWNRLASLAREGDRKQISLPGGVQAELREGILSVTRRSDDD